MGRYYSKCQNEFSVTPKVDWKTKQYAAKYSKSNFFKQIGPGTWKFIDSANSKLYNIDLKENFCNCKYFLKYKSCGHLIALMQLLNSDDFINKPKRGAQRKALKPLVKDN